MTTIHLALVDDWELSGNGSGNIRQLQFEPMRRLVGIYNRLGIRSSFNAEVGDSRRSFVKLEFEAT
jgi:hypothetical protein